jgi:hypothetical protein
MYMYCAEAGTPTANARTATQSSKQFFIILFLLIIAVFGPAGAAP